MVCHITFVVNLWTLWGCTFFCCVHGLKMTPSHHVVQDAFVSIARNLRIMRDARFHILHEQTYFFRHLFFNRCVGGKLTLWFQWMALWCCLTLSSLNPLEHISIHEYFYLMGLSLQLTFITWHESLMTPLCRVWVLISNKVKGRSKMQLLIVLFALHNSFRPLGEALSFGHLWRILH